MEPLQLGSARQVRALPDARAGGAAQCARQDLGGLVPQARAWLGPAAALRDQGLLRRGAFDSGSIRVRFALDSCSIRVRFAFDCSARIFGGRRGEGDDPILSLTIATRWRGCARSSQGWIQNASRNYPTPRDASPLSFATACFSPGGGGGGRTPMMAQRIALYFAFIGHASRLMFRLGLMGASVQVRK